MKDLNKKLPLILKLFFIEIGATYKMVPLKALKAFKMAIIGFPTSYKEKD
jgi:hypothetical protein